MNGWLRDYKAFWRVSLETDLKSIDRDRALDALTVSRQVGSMGGRCRLRSPSERQRNCRVDEDNALVRRVRVLRFGVDPSDPRAPGKRSNDGLRQADLIAFVSDMLPDYKNQLAGKAPTKALIGQVQTNLIGVNSNTLLQDGRMYVQPQTNSRMEVQCYWIEQQCERPAL
jgi:hypothetical protein